MSRRFEGFLDRLASAEVSERACNQYSKVSGDLRENAIRRRNLRLYLSQIDALRSDTVLIGEAPSYRGGRRTGIPFVSEAIMLSGVEIACGDHMLGADRGYRKATPGPQLSTEASATIVWSTIRHAARLPCLWNAFPFHPFEAGNPNSNRLPNASELQIGQPFIAALIRLCRIERVVAIGNQASRSLTQMGISHVKVRHPSQGGKQGFVAGMAGYL